MTNYKAAPEQWAKMEQSAESYGTCSCLLELRDRIAALETQRETEKAAILDIYEKLDRLKTQHESNWTRIVKLEEANQQPEPIDEEENDRRFRACLNAIDNATPEQIRAAVAKASADHFPDAKKMVPAPAGGLVERVAIAVCRCDDSSSWSEEVINWTPEARAAILAVAEWFDAIGYGATASMLRQEVERG